MKIFYLLINLLFFFSVAEAYGLGSLRRYVVGMERGRSGQREPSHQATASAEMNVHRDLSYAAMVQTGSSERQVLDIYAPLNAQSSPVWMYVHGGAWSSGNKQRAERSGMAADMVNRGYVVVAVSYSFTPPDRFPANVQDVAASVAWVRRNIGEYGGDPEQIYLMGHSAGAHLVSMVGTDASYLRAHGLRPGQLKGIVALDTQAYNLDLLAADSGGRLPPVFARAFGQDRNVRLNASPALRVSGDTAPPPFAIGYSGGRRGRAPEDRRKQANLFAEALRAHGGKAVVVSAPSTTHEDIMNNFGDPSDRVTTEALRAIGAPEGVK